MDIVTEDLRKIGGAKLRWDAFQGRRVLITGANGMIPSYIALSFLQRQKDRPPFRVELTLLSRDRARSEQIYGRFSDVPGLTLLTGDVCGCSFAGQRFDYVIHGASPADPRRYGADPNAALLANVDGTRRLLERACAPDMKAFLFLSSGEVYGAAPEGCEAVREDGYGGLDPLNIRNCYAEGKRCGEMLCAIWHRLHGVPAKIVRLSHTYGPSMDLRGDSRVFAEFVRNVVDGQDIVMKSDGSAVRPFCYLTDAVEGILTVLTDGEAGQAYNLSGDEYLSVLALANLLRGLSPGRDVQVVETCRPPEDRYLEAPARPPVKVSNQKLKALGWEPSVSVKEGFTRTILSFMESMQYDQP